MQKKHFKEVWAIVADIHQDYINEKALSMTEQILKDLKPDVLCSIGDETDYNGISKYTMKDYGDGVDECEEELRRFKITWERLVKAAGNPKQKMALGNHNGERVNKLLRKLKDKHKNREYRDVKKALDFKINFPNVEIKDYKDYFKKNGLAITHGEICSNNHAKAHAMTYLSNVIYGHLHTHDEFTLPQKISGKSIKGISVPCLCKLNPEYREGNSSTWENGITVVTFINGTFFHEVIIYKNNMAVFRGKLYK